MLRMEAKSQRLRQSLGHFPSIPPTLLSRLRSLFLCVLLGSSFNLLLPADISAFLSFRSTVCESVSFRSFELDVMPVPLVTPFLLPFHIPLLCGPGLPQHTSTGFIFFPVYAFPLYVRFPFLLFRLPETRHGLGPFPVKKAGLIKTPSTASVCQLPLNATPSPSKSLEGP